MRQLLDLKRLQQLNAQNAIIIRDTPDKLAIAEKMINDIDKARPEVVIQVQVLEARLDKMRNLGILPGQNASIGVVPPGTTTTTTNNGTNTNGTTNSTTQNILTLQNLTHLNGANYSVTLPSFTANALLNDSTTKIIQNPEVRSVDGQPAKLSIGDRVPVATGSFQAGVGVGSTAGTGFVNPLVNTQFQYIDVGVNVDITPRVHPNHEVSLKVSVEVSSVTGQTNIGGIQQPIISQRKIDHEIRLKEGEANILGGLVEKTDTEEPQRLAGARQRTAAALFVLRRYEELRGRRDSDYFDAEDRAHAGMDAGESAAAVHGIRSDGAGEARVGSARAAEPKCGGYQRLRGRRGESGCRGADVLAANPAQGAQSAQMRFEPRNVTMKAGEKTTIGVVVDNVNDLFSIPFLLQYNPAVISVEEVQHGGFLQAGIRKSRSCSASIRASTGRRLFPRRGSRTRPGSAGPERSWASW